MLEMKRGVGAMVNIRISITSEKINTLCISGDLLLDILRQKLRNEGGIKRAIEFNIRE